MISIVNLTFLCWLALEDFRHGLLPNRILVPYFLTALIMRITEGVTLLNDLGWAVGAVALLLPLWSAGWLGGGDLKVIPGLVLMNGAEGALRIWAMALVLSLSIMAAGTLIRRKPLRRLPLGIPLMAAALWLLLWR